MLGSLLSAIYAQNSAIEPIVIIYFQMIQWQKCKKREGKKNIQRQVNSPWPNTLIKMPKVYKNEEDIQIRV